MTKNLTYHLDDGIATIRLHDGKVNAMSIEMQRDILEAFDRAEADQAVVLLTAAGTVFSAGFHLPTVRAGGPEATAMVKGGFELAERVFSFPYPVVVASPGHAIAMGLFLLLCGDVRIGVSGDFKYAANEVAIDMTVPHAAIEILRYRLSPPAFDYAATTAATFDPDAAVGAGILHRVVDPAALEAIRRGIELDYPA